MRAARWRAVLTLPFNVLVTIPLLLVAWRGDATVPAFAGPRLWIGLACLAGGLSLMVGTIRRFDREGDGSLAPWDPTRRLVVTGVYRRVRNPMISGVVLNLAGEAVLAGSATLAAWAAFFFLGNAIYLPWFEEPGLEKRFGDEYRRYKAAVPRWIPRRTPWSG